MPTIHLIIKGRVQGVFFRATTKEKAIRMNLNGWVKNTQEGHVEVMVSGEEDKLDEFIKWCHRGPEKAVVSEVSLNRVSDEIFDGFRIKKDSFF